MPLHYARHRPAQTTLHRLVLRHAADFIAHSQASNGSRLPRVVKDEFDAFVGSHDSATREAGLATIKGRIPYVYTPVYEGRACSPNAFCLGETPSQQVQPAAEVTIEKMGARSFFLVGNDCVRPRKANEQVKRYVAQHAAKVFAGEYMPFSAPSKFEEEVTWIKADKPDAVVITVAGGDKVNFKRTFAVFGLAKHMKRLVPLLEGNSADGSRVRLSLSVGSRNDR